MFNLTAQGRSVRERATRGKEMFRSGDIMFQPLVLQGART